MVGVYFIKFQNGFKFGVCKDVNKVVKEFSKPWNVPIVDFYFISCSFPNNVIGCIRKKYKNYLVEGNDFIEGIDLNSVIVFSYRCSHFYPDSHLIISADRIYDIRLYKMDGHKKMVYVLLRENNKFDLNGETSLLIDLLDLLTV